MKRVMFELTMPNVGSWNGQWNGRDSKYTIAHKLLKKDDNRIIGKSFYYNFGDGWGANVEVREAFLREKATNKFCGYEWMIKSILKNGVIKC